MFTVHICLMMEFSGRFSVVKLFVLFTILLDAKAWDMDDLELFDVVEEVNRNFYELLGVDQTATSSEIKRAYRKLSLQYHPDKNKDDDAEVKFRQLVSVYEILKDETKRKKYHEVLENGLPDWRQPIYYYRRVRKMGIVELSVILSIIITIGQFITMWAIYAERKYTLEENFESVRKKMEKKIRKNKGNEDEIDEILQKELDAIPKPKFIKLWPFQLIRFLFYFMKNMPENVRYSYEIIRHMRDKHVDLDTEESDSEIETFERKPRVKRTKTEFPEAPSISSGDAPVVYGQSADSGIDSTVEDGLMQVKEGNWSEEDLALFAKAANKFPGGTPKRWEKIALMLGRSVADVTAKVKELKGTHVSNASVSLQNDVLKAGKKSQIIKDEIISKNEEVSENGFHLVNKGSEQQSLRKRHTKVPPKTPDRTLLISKIPVKTNPEQDNLSSEQVETGKMVEKSSVVVSDDSWNKNLQTIFEWALRQYPRGTDQRWEKIAEHIPGKSKEDCILRFKYLADLVKKRKTADDKTSTTGS